MFYIYKLTSPNGKVYIGQTKQDKLYKRWNYGSGYVQNKTLYSDILYFGWKNFKHEVLEEIETKEEAYQREREYVLAYRSNEPEYGYNKSTNASSQPKRYKYVRDIKTGELFETLAAAGTARGVTKQAISYAIKNKTPCKHHLWEFVELTEEEYELLRLAFSVK